MIADSVVLIALHYIDKGMKAERKLREMEALQEVLQAHESDKAAVRAQNGATRQSQRNNNKKSSKGGSGTPRNYTMQQPSKRD
jgi:hypothetical protein